MPPEFFSSEQEKVSWQKQKKKAICIKKRTTKQKFKEKLSEIIFKLTKFYLIEDNNLKA